MPEAKFLVLLFMMYVRMILIVHIEDYVGYEIMTMRNAYLIVLISK